MSIQRVKREYASRGTAKVAQFAEAMKNTVAPAGTFDSAAASDFASTTINQGDAGVVMPEKLQLVLDEYTSDEDKSRVMRAVYDGCTLYEQQHGCEVPADVIEQAIHSAYATTGDARRKFSLDSATSIHMDNQSLQSNRAIVAILSILTEAVPFAHYLPADIGSNQAKLAVMTHRAGGLYGGYAENAIMDGAYSGDTFISSSRVHKSTIAADTGNITGALTTVQSDSETCLSTAAAVKLLRGRSLVYVNGKVCATEITSGGSGASTVSGSATIDGTTYQIGGTINTDTGAIALTTAPKMPTTIPVHVEGFIDYERDATIVPNIITGVDVYDLYAKPWRVNTYSSMDAATQMANELGLDPYSESVLAIQSQFANERHYDVLRKMMRLAVNNQVTHDFAWSTRSAQMSRSQIWQDFAAPLGVASQKMAEDTLNHGITHMYVDKYVAAQLRGLPMGMFEPSGISDRPGIYRVGRLFGLVDVYYTPKGLSGNGVSSQILCVGRATDVTRNPIVMGDAVSPTVVPLAVNGDLKRGAGFYARNFTAVNPHSYSAQGAALINVTNLS